MSVWLHVYVGGGGRGSGLHVPHINNEGRYGKRERKKRSILEVFLTQIS